MNPYLTNSSSGTSNVKVNNIKPNVLGNVVVPLSSLPDVDIIDVSLASGEVLCYNGTKWSSIQQTPSTYPFSVLQPLSQKGVSGGYCSLDSSTKVPLTNIPTLDHTTLTNIGTNSHAQIDTFIASKSNAN